ncbi:MAG TPA: TIGR01458 family HAD-type hydrolase [Bryobacteraceae bacterium]|nr:TIGR01458 family HAD-type hydrolase [Bryobacteraceae bacterium]
MQAVLFDMDGVLYNSEEPIPGAAETLAWLRERRVPYLFVTNTTSRGRDALTEKLARFGIPASPEEIMTPCEAAADWLRSRSDGSVALFLRPAARAAFAGLDCLPDDAESGAGYVVIGDLASAWDFRTLNRAFRLLHANPAATLIALGMTRYWKAADGISMDVAPFVAALENASRRKALVFGKPAPAFFHAAAERLGTAAGEILMVGDDIESDIAGAQSAGMQAALVRTGKFRSLDLEGSVKPDAVLDSVAELPEWWELG